MAIQFTEQVIRLQKKSPAETHPARDTLHHYLKKLVLND